MLFSLHFSVTFSMLFLHFLVCWRSESTLHLFSFLLMVSFDYFVAFISNWDFSTRPSSSILLHFAVIIMLMLAHTPWPRHIRVTFIIQYSFLDFPYLIHPCPIPFLHHPLHQPHLLPRKLTYIITFVITLKLIDTLTIVHIPLDYELLIIIHSYHDPNQCH